MKSHDSGGYHVTSIKQHDLCCDGDCVCVFLCRVFSRTRPPHDMWVSAPPLPPLGLQTLRHLNSRRLAPFAPLCFLSLTLRCAFFQNHVFFFPGYFFSSPVLLPQPRRPALKRRLLLMQLPLLLQARALNSRLEFSSALPAPTPSISLSRCCPPFLPSLHLVSPPRPSPPPPARRSADTFSQQKKKAVLFNLIAAAWSARAPFLPRKEDNSSPSPLPPTPPTHPGLKHAQLRALVLAPPTRRCHSSYYRDVLILLLLNFMKDAMVHRTLGRALKDKQAHQHWQTIGSHCSIAAPCAAASSHQCMLQQVSADCSFYSEATRV